MSIVTVDRTHVKQAPLPRPVPARRPAPRPRELSAREVSAGVWRLSLESRSDPGTAHELTVTNGVAGPCDCTAARFGLECGHRKDAAHLAKALDNFYAALAGIRDIQAHWQTHYYPGIAGELEAERDRQEIARRCVQELGYRVVRAEVCDGIR